MTVLGRPAGSAELRHRVGYVTQDPTIYNDLRIIDNVRYFASLYGIDAHAADDAIDRSRTRTITEPRCAATSPAVSAPGCRWPARWSASPDLLVLDEPTVGLDPVLRVDLWEQFHQLARRGTTLLVSSHVMDEADHCGDLLLMRDGHLVAHTTPTKLREDTGCSHWRKRFCPSSGTAPQPQPAEPAGLPGHHHANPAPARRRSPQRRDDPRRAEPGHHVDVLHVPERARIGPARRRRSTTPA